MLKAWTERESLLILGLTFVSAGANSRNHISLFRETLDIPLDVVLLTAPNREQIAEAISAAHQHIIASRDEPIWHCLTRKHHGKSLHICLSQTELLVLRQRPLLSFYRLHGDKMKVSFDTLIIGATDEHDMIKFLTNVGMLDPSSKIETDLTQIRC